MAQWVKNLSAMQEMQETLIRFLGQKGPLQQWQPTHYYCLENPTDRGAWEATVHGAIL